MKKSDRRRQIKKLSNELASQVIAEEVINQHPLDFKKKRCPPVEALTEAQGNFIAYILRKPISFGIGPAGTGKTYVATALACDELEARQVDKIIITRPMLGCEEDIGFLPGEQDEKFTPWVKPFLDVMYDRMGRSKTEALIKSGHIEMAPLMMMRGSSFNRCWILLDEAQNVTPNQMKMFLTRIGDDAKMIITGDLHQSDLRTTRNTLKESGLQDAVNKFRHVKDIGFAFFDKDDIVRSGIVRQMLDIYEPDEVYRESP